MPKALSDALTILCYAVIGGAVMVGGHYGWITPGVQDFLLGGIATHLGLSYSKNGKNGAPGLLQSTQPLPVLTPSLQGSLAESPKPTQP